MTGTRRFKPPRVTPRLPRSSCSTGHAREWWWMSRPAPAAATSSWSECAAAMPADPPCGVLFRRDGQRAQQHGRVRAAPRRVDEPRAPRVACCRQRGPHAPSAPSRAPPVSSSARGAAERDSSTFAPARRGRRRRVSLVARSRRGGRSEASSDTARAYAQSTPSGSPLYLLASAVSPSAPRSGPPHQSPAPRDGPIVSMRSARRRFSGTSGLGTSPGTFVAEHTVETRQPVIADSDPRRPRAARSDAPLAAYEPPSIRAGRALRCGVDAVVGLDPHRQLGRVGHA